MKSMKKFLALALALALCFVMAIPALALEDPAPDGGDVGTPPTTGGTGTHTLTLSTTVPGHTYSIYQIYTGDIDGTDNGFDVTPGGQGNGIRLSNIKYGAQYPVTGNQTVGKYVAQTELDSLDGMKNNDDDIRAWADQKWAEIQSANIVARETKDFTEGQSILTFENLEPGYYLVVDNGFNGAAPEGDAKSALLVEVVGNTEMKAKVTTTTFDKQVETIETIKTDADDVKYSTDDATAAKIGDTIGFRLVTTIPAESLGQYDYYTVEFLDKMSAGFDFDKNSVTVKILTGSTLDEATQVGNNLNIKENYTWYSDDLLKPENKTQLGDFIAQSGYGFKDGDKKTNQVDGKEVTTTPFNLEIADVLQYLKAGNQTIPTTGNVYVVLTYQATLNDKADLNKGEAGTENENTASVKFTNDPENGGKGGKTPDDKVYVYSFELDITKVDAGETDESKNKLVGVKFELADENGNKMSFLQKNTGEYVVYNAEKADSYNTSDYKSMDPVTELETQEGGKLLVDGLVVGKYTLTETEPLPGFNKCDPIEIEIKANPMNDKGQNQDENGKDDPYAGVSITTTPKPDGQNPATTDLNTASTENSSTSMTVQNKKGTLLPSTGGIGTTIFYAVGGALVVGAGVLLFVRKRMGSKG